MPGWTKSFCGGRTCPGCGLVIAEEAQATLVEIEPVEACAASLSRCALWHRSCAIAADPLLAFTPKELAIGELLTRGRTSGTIARLLKVSESTVKGKLTRMKRKSGTTHRGGIVLFLRRANEARQALKRAA